MSFGRVVGWAVVGEDIKDFDPRCALYRKMPCASHLDRDMPGANEYRYNMPILDTLKAKTDDDGKPPLAYLPWAGIDEVAMVQAFGHKKYHDFYNYRKGLEVGRNLSCAIRHIRAFMEGEDLDPESERNHLAHACCRLLFTLQNIHDKKEIDDRFTKRK